MSAHDEFAIAVTGRWDDWRSVMVRVEDLTDVHWHQPTRAPRPLIHAYVVCRGTGTDVPVHSCEAGAAPHRLRVCILKCHTLRPVYADLVRRADETIAAASDPPLAPSGLRTDRPVGERFP